MRIIWKNLLTNELNNCSKNVEKQIYCCTNCYRSVNFLKSIKTNLKHDIYRSIADCLKKGDPVVPENYQLVTLYFSDIVGFTSLCDLSSSMEVVTFLNLLYSGFDHLMNVFDVYKVEQNKLLIVLSKFSLHFFSGWDHWRRLYGCKWFTSKKWFETHYRNIRHVFSRFEGNNLWDS